MVTFLLGGCSDALLSCSCMPGAWECVHACVCVCVSTCLRGSCVPNMWGSDPAVTNHAVGGLSESTENKMYVHFSAGTGRELSVVNIYR